MLLLVAVLSVLCDYYFLFVCLEARLIFYFFVVLRVATTS